MATVRSDIDGGHAWLILVVGIIMTCFESINTLGIFYMAILEKYQRDHYATIWIQTLDTAGLYFAGLIAAVIIEKKGCRFAAILAGIIYVLSFLTSCFTPTLEVLYVSLGMGTGFSQSLLVVTVYTIVPYYFNKNLGMAIGFTNAGYGIGLFIYSALNGFLVATYGLQGTFLILTAVAANIIPLGLMMRKPPNTKGHATKMQDHAAEQDEDCEKQSLLTENKPGDFVKEAEEQSLLKSRNDARNTESELFNFNDNLEPVDIGKDMTPSKKQNSSCQNTASFFYTSGLDLFTNKYYTILILATTFISIPHHVFHTVIPDHIKWTGGTEWQATSSLVIIGAANAISRLSIWKLSNDEIYRSIDVLTISSLLSGTGLVCTLFLYEYWMYIILCVLYGFTRGVYMIYYGLLLIQIVGKGKSSSWIWTRHDSERDCYITSNVICWCRY